jgi:hypothetical protein
MEHCRISPWSGTTPFATQKAKSCQGDAVVDGVDGHEPLQILPLSWGELALLNTLELRSFHKCHTTSTNKESKLFRWLLLKLLGVESTSLLLRICWRWVVLQDIFAEDE